VRGIGYRTALGLLAQIGDWRRFSHPRQLAAYLGLLPTREQARRWTLPRSRIFSTNASRKITG
jgi:transposase